MSNLKSFILDILFPRRCLGCDILLTDEFGHYICRACLRGIKFQNTFACTFCASPVVKGVTCPYCRQDHSLDRLLVVTSYENTVIKRIIKSTKYRFVRKLAEQIGSLMANYVKKQAGRWQDLNSIIIVPVPLHPKRLRWRGFNHAEIMAKTVGQEFGFEIITDALTRVRDNKPQADLPDQKSRIANMAMGTFQCICPALVRDQQILLIDDLSTTGSTLEDCARALKGAGAKEVTGLVFARGTTETRKNRKNTEKQDRRLTTSK